MEEDFTLLLSRVDNPDPTMLSRRFLLLRSAASFTTRSFCTGGVSKQGRAPDMVEGNPLLHVSNVRNRLREIVGASTNWSDHQQAMAERLSLSSMLAKSQSDLPAKRMKDSYLEVHLPLGSEPQLREIPDLPQHCQVWQDPGGLGQFSSPHLLLSHL